jgi:hypothetical protein
MPMATFYVYIFLGPYQVTVRVYTVYPVDHFEVSIICLSYVLYAAEDIDNGEKMQNILCLMSASYLYMLSMVPYSTQYPW